MTKSGQNLETKFTKTKFRKTKFRKTKVRKIKFRKTKFRKTKFGYKINFSFSNSIFQFNSSP